MRTNYKKNKLQKKKSTEQATERDDEVQEDLNPREKGFHGGLERIKNVS